MKIVLLYVIGHMDVSSHSFIVQMIILVISYVILVNMMKKFVKEQLFIVQKIINVIFYALQLLIPQKLGIHVTVYPLIGGLQTIHTIKIAVLYVMEVIHAHISQ